MMNVDFMIISKDFKESWSKYSEIMTKIKQLGLIHSIEHGGDEFGIDEDYMVFSDSKELYNHSSNLIQAAIFELEEEPVEEEDKMETEGEPILSHFEKDQKGNFILHFKNGDQHRCLIPPWNQEWESLK